MNRGFSTYGRAEAKVTITDIARESGVSPSTVSLVLRNKPGVGQRTRQRVLKNAAAMGYQHEATNFSTVKSTQKKSIGLILKVRPNDQMQTNFFYAPVLNGIESFCRQAQINLLYAHMPVDEENNPLEPSRLFNEAQANGLLVVGAYLNKPLSTLLQKQGKPTVLVDSYAELNHFDMVLSDNEAGAFEATSYLIQNGHQRIGIVGSRPTSYPSILARRQGFEAAMQAAMLKPLYIDCAHHPEEVAKEVGRFLQAGGEKRITAIFVVNDEAAVSVMRTAQAAGLRVPEDLSIIGYDNISLAEHVSPALTTMRVDKMGMGRLAAQLLLNRLSFPNTGQVQTIMRPSLIERQSVKQNREIK